MVTHQLQVERRTGKVRRPETEVLPTVPVGIYKSAFFPRYESAKKLLGLRKRNRNRYRDPQQRFTKPQS